MSDQMKAVIYPRSGSLAAPDALVDATVAHPGRPKGRDLLVRVRAVSVNPVDYKAREGRFDIATGGTHILGWDAAGIVEDAGPEATSFRPGDEVYYAGALERAGSNAEFQLIDERIVGPKPKTLTFAEAAALPLTGLTAWEMLFDRFGLSPTTAVGKTLLIIGAAGGVGSIATQIGAGVLGLRVIGTASRPESRAFATALGAEGVVDHNRPLAPQLAQIGAASPEFIFVTAGEAEHAEVAADLVAPQGRIGFIIPPPTLNLAALFQKSASVHMEFMFTRHLFATNDMSAQARILSEVAQLVDAGRIRTTLYKNFGRICAGNLAEAHRLIETGRAIGKIVLEGF